MLHRWRDQAEMQTLLERKGTHTPRYWIVLVTALKCSSAGFLIQSIMIFYAQSSAFLLNLLFVTLLSVGRCNSCHRRCH